MMNLEGKSHRQNYRDKSRWRFARSPLPFLTSAEALLGVFLAGLVVSWSNRSDIYLRSCQGGLYYNLPEFSQLHPIIPVLLNYHKKIAPFCCL